MNTVTVIARPGVTMQVNLNGNNAVSAAIELAGMSSSDFKSVEINGVMASFDSTLNGGDTLVLRRKPTTGNRA